MAKRPVDQQNRIETSSPPKQAGQAVPETHVIVGVIGAAHGLRGEVRMKSYTEDPMAVGDYGPLRLPDGRVVRVKALRPVRDDLVIVRIEGVTDRTAAEQLTGLPVSVEKSRLPALEDEEEFYHADLVGLKAVDAAGQVVGHIVGLFNYGAGDMLEIRLNKPAPTDFLPFTKAFVPTVDVTAGFVEVVLPDDFAKPAAPPPQSAQRGSGNKTKPQSAGKAKGPAAS